jgi:pre-mRNA-splicing helicase BRR2
LTNPNGKVTNYGYIHDEVYLRCERERISLTKILENDYVFRGNMAPAHVQEMHKFAKTLPYIDIDVQMQPITRSILKISLTIYAEWNWNDRWNGRSEPFWIVIDNGSEILH